MKGPLSGIRVLTLETFLAAPFGTMVLGDLGAEVIKVEPTQGEGSRLTAGADYKGESSHYLAYNRNKKGVTLDLSIPTGREAFTDLVRISDVVVQNMRPGVMERLGFGYEDLKAINPKVILCSYSGYGPTGPYSGWPAVESTASGISGIMSITGEPEGRPCRPGPAVSDLANALYGVIGIISALYERERTGTGQQVMSSLLGASVSFMSFHVSWYTCSGEELGPLGSGYPHAVPYGALKCQDGYIVVGPCWPRICNVIGAEHLIDDPRFKELGDRLKNRWELNEEIEKHLSLLTADEWLPIFHEHDIAVAPLNKVSQMVEDPQVNHMDMIVSIEHALGGAIKLAGNPIMMDSIKGEHTSPPTLGQDTEGVLKELLGYSDEKIKKMREEQEANREELEKHVRKRRR
ncbi:CaiB/BaiF CoA transferase family protein [Chloroflexota bacterium]